MSLRYARLDGVIKKLAGRLTVVDLQDYGITGVTGTQIGTDLIYLSGESIEEMMDLYIGMVYVLPLVINHPYLSGIAEKLIVSDIHSTYFPSQLENPDNSNSFSSVLRQQALNEFQVLFDGLGIFVPGSTNSSNGIQNDENKSQMNVKPVFLRGETIKKYIGYDLDGDNISDTDLYKLNANVQPSFYTTGQFDKVTETENVVSNIRVRPTGYKNTKVEVDFYGG